MQLDTYKGPAKHMQQQLLSIGTDSKQNAPRQLEILQMLKNLDIAKDCYKSRDCDEESFAKCVFQCADALKEWPTLYLPLFRERGIIDFALSLFWDDSLSENTFLAAVLLLNNVVFTNDDKPSFDLGRDIIARAFSLLDRRGKTARLAILLINNLLHENFELSNLFISDWFDKFIDLLLNSGDREDVRGLSVLVPMLSHRAFPLALDKRMRIFDALQTMIEAKALWQFSDSLDLLLDSPESDIISEIYGSRALDRELAGAVIQAPSEQSLSTLCKIIKKMPDTVSIRAVPHRELAAIARDNSYEIAIQLGALNALIEFIRMGGEVAVTGLSEQCFFGDIADSSESLPFSLKLAAVRLALVAMLKGTREQTYALALMGLHKIALDMIVTGEESLIHKFTRVIRRLLRDERTRGSCVEMCEDIATAITNASDPSTQDILIQLQNSIEKANPC